MLNLFQLDAPLLVSILILLAMSFISLVFSLSLYSRSRAIQKLPSNLSVNVFDKTFNVLNPYPEQRKMIHSSLEFLPIIISVVALFFSYVVLVKIIEMGLLLGLIIFIICAALMAVEVSFEIHKNAGLLLKAIENKVDLGKDDLTALSTVKETLPKLRMYYLSLAIVFFGFAVMLPYILPAAMLMVAKFLGALIDITASGGILAPFYAVFLFVVAVFMIHVTISKVKRKIFNLPPSEPLISLNKPFEAMRQWVIWQHAELLYRPPPEPDETLDSEREKS